MAVALSEALLSGELDGVQIAQHMAARETWLSVVDGDKGIQAQLGHLVERVERGDKALIDRLRIHTDWALRLFALAPALPMLRVFNAIEQDDPVFIERLMSGGQRVASAVPVDALAHGRFEFLQALNTLTRVLSRRADIHDVRLGG